MVEAFAAGVTARITTSRRPRSSSSRLRPGAVAAGRLHGHRVLRRLRSRPREPRAEAACSPARSAASGRSAGAGCIRARWPPKRSTPSGWPRTAARHLAVRGARGAGAAAGRREQRVGGVRRAPPAAPPCSPAIRISCTRRRAPGTRYTSAPDLDVAGAAYVGGPVVQVGRNRDGAWSVTNLTADDAEVVLERSTPRVSGSRAPPGAGSRCRRARCRSPCAARSRYVLTVRRTRNGPLLDGIATLAGADDAVRRRSTGRARPRPASRSPAGSPCTGAAASTTCSAPAPDFDGAPFESNFIYADAKGHIAHLALGSFPPRERRSAPAGARLAGGGSPGRASGRSAASRGASIRRSGAVWTANETHRGPPTAPAAGTDSRSASMPYRARRIRSVLVGRRTIRRQTSPASSSTTWTSRAQANLSSAARRACGLGSR